MIFSLARALLGRGHSVFIVDFFRGLRPRVEDRGGVTAYNLPQPFHLGPTMNRALMFTYALISSLSLLVALPTLRRRTQADVVHVHASPQLIACWFAKLVRWPGTRELKLVYTLHSPRWMEPLRMQSWERAIGSITDLLAVRLADVTTFESPVLKEKIQALTGICDGKTLVLYNGVDPRMLGVRADETEPEGETVLYAARFSEQKNQLLVISAAHKVIARNPRVRFVFIGGAESSHYLRRVHERTSQLGLLPYVTILPEVPFEQLNQIRARCGIHLLFSQYTGFDVALAETLAFGRATVLSDLPTLRGLICDRVHALLVEPHDDARLAEAILELADDRTLRMTLATNAKRLALERLDWRALADQFVQTVVRIPDRT